MVPERVAGEPRGPQARVQRTDPRTEFADTWGIAIRPAGLGGRFWVTANTTKQSIEYVGDVGGVPLFQDELKVVGTIGTPTGVVFNGGSQFVVTQPHAAAPITNAARFLFANDSGEITAWTERPRAGGGFDRPDGSVTVVDGGKAGAAFFGIGISSTDDRLYAADFGAAPQLRVYDGTFKELAAHSMESRHEANPRHRRD